MASSINDKIFQLLVERVRDYGVFVLDPEGHILTWNAGAQAMKGYTAEEIIGRHFSVFYTDEANRRNWPAHELATAAREGRFEDEGWRVRNDGSRFWANVIITALRDEDGRLLGFSKFTRDLTARRMEEEALRESEERFRLLIEGVVDYAIYMLDPDGIVTSWNSGAQRIKGYTRDQIIGRHFSQFYTAGDVAASKPWEQLAAARRHGRIEEEGWLVRKNGERFLARIVISALYDAEGRLRGFAQMTQDLTQREQAREFEQAAEHVTEFIAMLAHELRNPLAPIRNALFVMERMPPDAPAQTAMRQTIGRQLAHLTRIVDDVLDISRITRGTLSFQRRTVEIADVVARAVEIVAPSVEESRHTLTLDVPNDPLRVEGDVDRLTQLLVNLLTNAVRFTPAGGRIALEVRRQMQAGKPLIAISVRDSGRGIAAADLQGIFGMFVQGKEPIHRVGGGLGIGLALARRIAEMHDGTIEARSAGEGKGSEFILRIPAAAKVEDAANETKAHGGATPGGVAVQRVLIVDDNVDAANTFEMLLQSLGHTTLVAYDGRSALELVDRFKPDLVLLDIGLPGMSGYEVARQLRMRKIPRLRIVAVTGWGTESDRLRSHEAGFDVHLVKPIDESSLRKILEDDVGPLH